jgi:hypothetical protein
MARREQYSIGDLTITGKIVNESTSSDTVFTNAWVYTVPTGGTTATLVYPFINGGDIMLGHYATTDDTDSFNQAKATNGGLLYKLSADPLTAHSLAFASVRNNASSQAGLVAPTAPPRTLASSRTIPKF